MKWAATAGGTWEIPAQWRTWWSDLQKSDHGTPSTSRPCTRWTPAVAGDPIGHGRRLHDRGRGIRATPQRGMDELVEG